MYNGLWSAVLLLFLMGCGSASQQADKNEPVSQETSAPQAGLSFKTIESSESKLVTEIRCERGIGRGVIARPGAVWPEQVIVQLHVRGLEAFTVAADEMDWELNVSSSHEHKITSRLADREVVSEGMDLVVYVMPGKQPLSKIPLAEGQFFEITLPRELFEASPAEITLSWIDFYR